MLSKKDIDEILDGIHRGKITITSLPNNLYLDTAKKLQKGLYQGYGVDLGKIKITNPDWNTLNKLRTNLYVFSGAKTFQNIKDTQALIFDEKGMLRPYSDFEVDARKVMDIYNDAWLETEYNTTISQADAAARWEQYEEEKEDFPLLQFKTAGDANVRADHAQYDGMIFSVDDPVWEWLQPPLDWNCRCELIQIREGLPTMLKPGQKEDMEAGVNPLFRINPGKDKYIFKESGKNSHPYFNVGQKYEVLKRNNFGLKIPKP